MYKPDHVIVRKIKEYDPHLFVTWNDRKQYFEIWRSMVWGRRLITPVTQSIYDPKAPIKFTPLDERILWWLYDADSWRAGKITDHSLEADRRWKEWLRKSDEKKWRERYDLAKDIWAGANSFFATKHASKNSKTPKFNSAKKQQNWIRPDSQSRTASRAFARTASNARAYGYKK